MHSMDGILQTLEPIIPKVGTERMHQFVALHLLSELMSFPCVLDGDSFHLYFTNFLSESPDSC